MPVKIRGTIFYNTSEACRLAGTNRNTFLRWVREGRFPDITRRDRNGWRLFASSDVKRLKQCVSKIQKM